MASGFWRRHSMHSTALNIDHQGSVDWVKAGTVHPSGPNARPCSAQPTCKGGSVREVHIYIYIYENKYICIYIHVYIYINMYRYIYA